MKLIIETNNEYSHLNSCCGPWQRVLTAEYIDGYKVSDVKGIKTAGLDIKDVDSKLVNAFAEQIFHTGFVHADPHPGNSEFFHFPYHPVVYCTIFLTHLVPNITF